jgi:hypothetical protein
MNRLVLRCLAAAVVSAAGATPALAVPPQRDFVQIPAGFSFEFPCPNFIATLYPTGGMNTITFSSGRQIVSSPNLRVTVVAPNGNSVSYVITGVSRYEPLPDTNIKVTSTGRNLLLVPEANGHPSGLFLTIGNVNYILDSTGMEEVQTFSGTGTVVDVCRLLE